MRASGMKRAIFWLRSMAGSPRASIRFFFSSRRRHTRYWRDWSSDVCSSDLPIDRKEALVGPGELGADVDVDADRRSEERRVGKECRSGRGASEEEKIRRALAVARQQQARL